LETNLCHKHQKLEKQTNERENMLFEKWKQDEEKRIGKTQRGSEAAIKGSYGRWYRNAPP